MLAVGVVVAEREVAEGEFDVAAEAGGARVRSRAFQESRRVGGGVARGDARGRGRGGVRGLAGEDRRARGDVCVVILGGDGARVEVRRGDGRASARRILGARGRNLVLVRVLGGAGSVRGLRGVHEERLAVAPETHREIGEHTVDRHRHHLLAAADQALVLAEAHVEGGAAERAVGLPNGDDVDRASCRGQHRRHSRDGSRAHPDGGVRHRRGYEPETRTHRLHRHSVRAAPRRVRPRRRPSEHLYSTCRRPKILFPRFFGGQRSSMGRDTAETS